MKVAQILHLKRIMNKFDFKKYHVRAMNASSVDEKNSINAELKKMYDTLCEAEKKRFNEELQHFLEKELKNIDSVYNGVNLN